MNAKEALCNRQERRFKTCDGQSFRCDAVVTEDEPRQGTVIDISPSGLRFLCDGKFGVGQSLSTELKTDRSYGTFRGVIRRVEPWVGGQCILGCQLLDLIPNDVLEELAHEGVVNRRSDDRVDWNQPARLGWELEREVDIEIHDCSPGGLRISTDKAIPDTVRVRIRVDIGDDEPMVVDAKRVWQLEENTGYVAGLAFTKRVVPDAVARILERKHPGVVTPAATRGSKVRLGVLVTAAAAVFSLVLWQTGFLG